MGDSRAKGYESGIISILLNAKDSEILEIMSQLKKEDFNRDDIFRYIYTIICHLVANNMDLNVANLAAEIKKYKGLVSRMGGEARVHPVIEDLRDVACNPKDYQVYIDNIKKYRLVREIQYQGVELANILHDDEKIANMSLNEVAALPEKLFVEVSNSQKVEGFHASQDIRRFRDINEEDVGKVKGILSRFDSINKILLGYEPGLMYVYSGLSGKGKSLFLENEADHIGIVQNIPTLVIDTELTKNQFQIRLLSIRGKLRQREIKLGLFKRDPEKLKRLDNAIEEIENGSLYFSSVEDFSISSLQNLIRAFVIKHQIRVVIFDYIKLPNDIKGDVQNTYIIRDLVDTLKNKVAKKYNIPIITACQAKDELSEAESSFIRKLGDMVGFWNPKTQKQIEEDGLHKGTHYLQFHKFRDGEESILPRVYFEFQKGSSEIVEADNSHLAQYDWND